MSASNVPSISMQQTADLLVDTPENRSILAKRYIAVAEDQFSQFFLREFEHLCHRLKERLYPPLQGLAFKKVYPLASVQLTAFARSLTSETKLEAMIIDFLSPVELDVLIQFNPNLEKVTDSMSELLNVYEKLVKALNAFEENSDEETTPQRPEILCIHSMLQSEKWIQVLYKRLFQKYYPVTLSTSADNTLSERFKQSIPIYLKKEGPPLLQQKFTPSELEKLSQFLSHPLSKDVVSKMQNIADSFLNRVWFPHEASIRSRFVEILNNIEGLDEIYREFADMHMIVQGVFLGNRSAAGFEDTKEHQLEVRKKYFKRCGITHVICLSNIQKAVFPNDFTYVFYPILDSQLANISKHFEDSFEWIDKVVSNGGAILIHCDGGISRSATIVIAYLMRKFKLTYQAAFNNTKIKRICIQPNHGFEGQLRDYEAFLSHQ